MYRILLVDDEPWALSGIRSCYNWEENGFSIIYQTTFPQEALDVIVSQKPDAIVLDICMPEMSGIDLMCNVRKMGMDVEFVVISGYSDFNYAKEAIRYGAFHYLLKPIDEDEVAQVLGSLKNHLDNKAGIKDNDDLLNLLADFPNNREILEACFSKNGFPTSGVLYQAVVALDLTSSDCAKITFPPYVTCKKLKLGGGKYVFFLATVSNIFNYALSQWSDENIYVNTHFGISTPGSSVPDLFAKYKEADIAAGGGFLLYSERIFQYSNNDIAGSMHYISDVVSKMDFDQVESAVISIKELFMSLQIKRVCMDSITFFYNQIIARLSSACPDLFLSNDLDFLTYDQLSNKFKDVNDLVDYLTGIVLFIKTEQENANGNASRNFDNILKFINKNYNKRLFLKDLSNQFYLSTTYICDLFKEKMGKTFVEYITQLRMKKACELLRTTDHPIINIAEMVGYGDYCYFGKTFKKHQGSTPAAFRKETANT